jgi:hypothetical protein
MERYGTRKELVGSLRLHQSLCELESGSVAGQIPGDKQNKREAPSWGGGFGDFAMRCYFRIGAKAKAPLVKK